MQNRIYTLQGVINALNQNISTQGQQLNTTASIVNIFATPLDLVAALDDPLFTVTPLSAITYNSPASMWQTGLWQ